MLCAHAVCACGAVCVPAASLRPNCIFARVRHPRCLLLCTSRVKRGAADAPPTLPTWTALTCTVHAVSGMSAGELRARGQRRDLRLPPPVKRGGGGRAWAVPGVSGRRALSERDGRVSEGWLLARSQHGVPLPRVRFRHRAVAASLVLSLLLFPVFFCRSLLLFVFVLSLYVAGSVVVDLCCC